MPRLTEQQRWSRSSYFPLLALVAALAMTRCGAIEASRRSVGVVKDGSFSPGRPPAASYGVDPARICPSGGLMSFLPADVNDATKKSGAPAATPDGRLCAAAEALLGWEKKESPDESVVRFVSWYFGLPATIPRVTVTPVPTEDPKNMSGMLVDTIATYAKTAAQPRFGVATQRVRKDATKVVLLLQDMTVDLDPVPRRLELNSQAPLSGRLVGSHNNPKALISNVTGRLEKPSVPPGKAFSASLRCGDRPGRIQVEIRADEQDSESIVANFPVMCGVDPPTSVAIPPEQAAADPARDEKKVFELINAERSSGGLKPLAWDDAVAGVARSISQNLQSSTQFDIVGALAKVDVASPLVVQNPGRARTAEEAQARFSYSPTHRANYMNPDVTHGGVGVAPGPNDPNGRPTVIISELFVKQLPPVDTKAAKEKLRAAIARRRTDARAPALATDPTLEQVAQRYAEALAGSQGHLPKARQDEILAPVRKSFRTVNVIAGTKTDPLEFAEEPGIVVQAKVVGIGVAQGSHSVLGKNATYVAVLTGTLR